MTDRTLLTILAAAFVVYVVLPAANALIGQEVLGWIPILSRSLTRAASMQLPPAHRGRWLAEVNADLAELEKRPLTALLHAVDVFYGARRLRRELAEAPNETKPPVLDEQPVVVPARSFSRAPGVSYRRVWLDPCDVARDLVERRFDTDLSVGQIELAVSHVQACKACRETKVFEPKNMARRSG
jgi:hypothetical protein